MQVTSTSLFDGAGPKENGLHDLRLGPLEFKHQCVTCGLRRDCPGHLGMIKLGVPVIHPTLIAGLTHLLKVTCLRCKRLRADKNTCSLYLKRFELVQAGMMAELNQFDVLAGKKGRGLELGGSLATGEEANAIHDNAMARRVELTRILKALETKNLSEENLSVDISGSNANVELWNAVRKQFFADCSSSCAHCARTYHSAIRRAAGDAGIVCTWRAGSQRPFTESLWAESIDSLEPEEPGQLPGEEVKVERRGRESHTFTFQGYHLHGLLQSLFESDDRPLLHFLFPISRRLCFF